MAPDLVRRAVAELVATLVLVFVLALVVTSAAVGGDSPGVAAVTVALAHGLLFGAFLGASLHANPAVTVAALVKGRLGPAEAGAAVAGQAVGAVAGAALARSSVSEALWRQAELGAPGPASDLGITAGQALLVEALLVAGVVWVLLTLPERPWWAAAALTAGVLAAWQFTGGALNPARSLGAGVAGGFWDDQWAYWVGPISGAVFAAATANVLTGRRGERSDIVLD